MSGFPTRPNRQAFGPDGLVDTYPVLDETKAIPAKVYKLAWWQVAGMSLVSPKACFLVKRSGSTYTAEFQGLAFDAKQSQPAIEFARTSAGTYTWSFPNAEYADQEGNLVTLVLVGGITAPQSFGESGEVVSGTHRLTNPRAGTSVIFDVATGNPTDIADGGSFLLVLW